MVLKIFLFVAISILFAAIAMTLWRQSDKRHESRAWQELMSTDRFSGETYSSAMVEGLPEPAQRYFNYAIEEGAPLHSVVMLSMSGDLSLGTKETPNYQPMQAEQVLAPPFGLVWKLEAGPIAGSDGAMPTSSWTRFWLFGLLPVARADGPDHQRSAFGRVVAEAAIWSPASLLPGAGVSWKAVSDDTSRATVRFHEFTQAVDLTVAEDGHPVSVLIQRWSNVNDNKIFRERPFGGTLSEFRTFNGYRLPTHVEGGNHFGTEDYFPFFRADVSDIQVGQNRPDE